MAIYVFVRIQCGVNVTNSVNNEFVDCYKSNIILDNGKLFGTKYKFIIPTTYPIRYIHSKTFGNLDR